MTNLLDLFCGAGGAGKGYSDAMFEVFGVDIAPEPNYPFWFHQGNALEVMETLLAGGSIVFRCGVQQRTMRLEGFDAIHGSPPCQGYTALAAVHGNEWPKLVEPVRELFEAAGLPYVIENVQGSPVRRDLTLCGEMFKLGVIRHRYFELGNWSITPPTHIPHRGKVAGWRHGEYFDGPYFAVYGNGGGKGTVAQWQTAMGIHWTDDRHEIAEAIPPQYTEFIGLRLMDAIERAAA